MKPIFLIGYMGSGKSAVGRSLAKALKVENIDLDKWIEQRFRSRVSDMFAEIGEEGFRKRERAMLEEVAGIENAVISTGGGTPCFFDNMKIMKEAGVTIYLSGSTDTIVKRVTTGHGNRPLLKEKSEEELRLFITRHLEEREPYYAKADITVETDSRKLSEITEEILDKIRTNI